MGCAYSAPEDLYEGIGKDGMNVRTAPPTYSQSQAQGSRVAAGMSATPASVLAHAVVVSTFDPNLHDKPILHIEGIHKERERAVRQAVRVAMPCTKRCVVDATGLYDASQNIAEVHIDRILTDGFEDFSFLPYIIFIQGGKLALAKRPAVEFLFM